MSLKISLIPSALANERLIFSRMLERLAKLRNILALFKIKIIVITKFIPFPNFRVFFQNSKKGKYYFQRFDWFSFYK